MSPCKEISNIGFNSTRRLADLGPLNLLPHQNHLYFVAQYSKRCSIFPLRRSGPSFGLRGQPGCINDNDVVYCQRIQHTISRKNMKYHNMKGSSHDHLPNPELEDRVETAEVEDASTTELATGRVDFLRNRECRNQVCITRSKIMSPTR